MSVDLNAPGRIMWFDDLGTGNPEYRFLSNFYEGVPIEMPDGQVFATGEHAFAAYKAAHPAAFAAIQGATSPGEAKSMGRKCTLRPDWEAVKYDVMAAVIRSKFGAGREEATLLLRTGDALLVEGTYWGDRVWGVDLKSYADREVAHLAPGRNWLGTLLMARRAELRALTVHGYCPDTETHNYEFFG